jgi:CxxC motif-containing protein (DUF1111 family)
MRRYLVIALLAACGGDPDGYEPGEELSGGTTTVFDDTGRAYSNPLANLEGERRDGFFVGNSLFNRSWVVAPASTTGLDGLGPTFNATSCSTCHFKDGRGRPPEPGEPMRSMLIRLSMPDGSPEPTYGGQLQNASIPGVPVEGRVEIDWEDVPGTYDDGTPYTLRRPSYRFEDLAFGPLAEDVVISPRVAPANYGLGLLEAIPDGALEQLADPDDDDGDGISGRRGEGRFGWKASQPTVRSQSAGAFLGDIGITSMMNPTQNCTAVQTECLAAISGGDPELDDAKLDDIEFYGQTLAVPGRRDWDDATVLAGKARFHDTGCASCHVPSFQTTEYPVPELVDQTIWPYTDLLLHDVGEDLDGEWRTPPLWGLGLLGVVNEHDELLHDGRARGFAEAILWHGGEASSAREAFRAMDADDRDALIRFLESQ